MAKIKCDICGKVCNGKNGLVAHRRIHKGADSGQAGEKILIIPCSLGGNSFNVRVGLKIDSVAIVDA